MRVDRSSPRDRRETRNGLKNFELQVIKAMACDVLSDEMLDELANSGIPVVYEYTGCGYFVTVEHNALPAVERTLSVPPLVGALGEVVCGFVVYLGKHELTLEIHEWGPFSVTNDFREGDVVVRDPMPCDLDK